MPDEECICVMGKESEEGAIPFDRDPNCPVHGDSSDWFQGEKLEESSISDSRKKRLRRTFFFVTKAGNEFVTNNIIEFCKENHINNINKVISGKRIHSKGFYLRKIYDPNDNTTIERNIEFWKDK
jgi:hypothetical protein